MTLLVYSLLRSHSTSQNISELIESSLPKTRMGKSKVMQVRSLATKKLQAQLFICFSRLLDDLSNYWWIKAEGNMSFATRAACVEIFSSFKLLILFRFLIQLSSSIIKICIWSRNTISRIMPTQVMMKKGLQIEGTKIELHYWLICNWIYNKNTRKTFSQV